MPLACDPTPEAANKERDRWTLGCLFVAKSENPAFAILALPTATSWVSPRENPIVRVSGVVAAYLDCLATS